MTKTTISDKNITEIERWEILLEGGDKKDEKDILVPPDTADNGNCVHPVGCSTLVTAVSQAKLVWATHATVLYADTTTGNLPSCGGRLPAIMDRPGTKAADYKEVLEAKRQNYGD